MRPELAKRLLATLDDDEIVELERSLVRIPSFTFEEAELAGFLAQYMSDAGIEVELHEVADPYGSGRTSRQPVGIIRGEGRAPSLMLNGHMDHNPLVGEWTRDPFGGEIEEEWLYGRGSIDEKGGLTDLVMAAVAIKRTGLSLNGDLLLCPVMGHKSGGIGSKFLIEQGIVADMVINTENCDLGVATRSVGDVTARITFTGHPVHFRTPAAEKAKAANPIEKLGRFVSQLGTPQMPMDEGDWLTFSSDPELPGYPQFNFVDLTCERLPDSFCRLEMSIRLVPGQSAETVRDDLSRLIADLSINDPTLNSTLEVPPHGGWDWPPYSTPEDNQLVTTISKWHEFVTGEVPETSANPRLGAVGDANFFADAGIPAVQYGPGRGPMFKQWPTPDECIFLPDLITGARVMALVAADICGAH